MHVCECSAEFFLSDSILHFSPPTVCLFSILGSKMNFDFILQFERAHFNSSRKHNNWTMKTKVTALDDTHYCARVGCKVCSRHSKFVHSLHLTDASNSAIVASAAFSLALLCAGVAPPVGRVAGLAVTLAPTAPAGFTGAFAAAAGLVVVFAGTFLTAAGLGAPYLLGAEMIMAHKTV